MSLNYAVIVQLTALANEQNIKKILTNGLELGCTYYPDIWPQATSIKPLPIDDAVSTIFEHLHSEDELPCVLAQLSDTLMSIFFRPTKKNSLKITLNPVASIWKIKDDDGFLKIDFSRYIGVMSALCKDSVIECIEIESE